MTRYLCRTVKRGCPEKETAWCDAAAVRANWQLRRQLGKEQFPGIQDTLGARVESGSDCPNRRL